MKDDELYQMAERVYVDYFAVLRDHQTRTSTCGPHCDSWMLHSPGVCPTCDEYASDLQEARKQMKIAFTDLDPQPDERPCPASIFRNYDQISRWPGNRPEGYQWPSQMTKS